MATETIDKQSGGWDNTWPTRTTKGGLKILTGATALILTEITACSRDGHIETKYYVGTSSGGSEVGTGDLTNSVATGLTLALSADTTYYITTDKAGASRLIAEDSTSVSYPYNFTLLSVTASVCDWGSEATDWVTIQQFKVETVAPPLPTATIGEKELKRNWPHETGLIAETTKQEGRVSNLIAQQGTTVLSRNRKGID